MDALALGFLVVLTAVMLAPIGVLGVRMLVRMAYTRRLHSITPIAAELRYTVAYLCLQAVALGLGALVFPAIGLVGVPVLVLYFVVRLLTLPNFVVTSTEYCENCRYSMAGLDAEVCPECGAVFSPGTRIDL